MNKQVATLLDKQMTRKEFMATLGFGIASVFGFSSVLKLVTGQTTPTGGGSRQKSNGYGSSTYGG